MITITEQERQLLEYAYKCGQEDALNENGDENKSMLSAIPEHAEQYTEETGNTVDWLWFEYFYLSGGADAMTGKGSFEDHFKAWFADIPQEESNA